ncbi:MAG: hypothetical protein WBE32_16310 [Pseudolabrys sp.]
MKLDGLMNFSITGRFGAPLSSCCHGASINVDGTAGGLLMPSGIVRNPVRPGDDFKARQKLELDRLRTAIAIVERMRQAGICCELYNDVKNGN